MKLSTGRMQKYLRMLTMSRVAAQDDPMHDVADFDEVIDQMADAARAAGEEDALRAAIDSLQAEPDDRLDPFRGSYYDWPDRELVALLQHAHARIWPDLPASLPGEAVAVEFVTMTDAEWAAYTGRG